VRHFVPAERVRLRYFLAWFFWSGITNAALDEQEPRRGRSFFGLPLYLVRRMIGAILLTPFAALAGRTDAALEHAVDAAFVAGYAAKRWGVIALQPPAVNQEAGAV
jgi:hypothetical protein